MYNVQLLRICENLHQWIVSTYLLVFSSKLDEAYQGE